jgi:hypothetical protein
VDIWDQTKLEEQITEIRQQVALMPAGWPRECVRSKIGLWNQRAKNRRGDIINQPESRESLGGGGECDGEVRGFLEGRLEGFVDCSLAIPRVSSKQAKTNLGSNRN